jgi:hypothetical protein
MRIVIETVPMSKMAYRTPADYWFEEDGGIRIQVAEELGEDMAYLVGMHEAVESYLVKKHGMSDELITMFDIEFEKKRVPGNEDEPGDDPHSPYQKEHGFATAVERILCSDLGVNWKDYEEANIKVMQSYGK